MKKAKRPFSSQDAWRTSVSYLRNSSICGLSHAARAPSYRRSIYWWDGYDSFAHTELRDFFKQ